MSSLQGLGPWSFTPLAQVPQNNCGSRLGQCVLTERPQATGADQLPSPSPLLHSSVSAASRFT